MILMGDFNCSWNDPVSAVRTIGEALGLRPPPEEAAGRGPATFPPTGKRLDWILVSPEFEIESFQVLPDVLSDHRAAWVKLRYKGEN
jgi:endonuclease/exonuclease/phosphatase family metal-dependent hydrolase